MGIPNIIIIIKNYFLNLYVVFSRFLEFGKFGKKKEHFHSTEPCDALGLREAINHRFFPIEFSVQSNRIRLRYDYTRRGKRPTRRSSCETLDKSLK